MRKACNMQHGEKVDGDGEKVDGDGEKVDGNGEKVASRLRARIAFPLSAPSGEVVKVERAPFWG